MFAILVYSFTAAWIYGNPYFLYNNSNNNCPATNTENILWLFISVLSIDKVIY